MHPLGERDQTIRTALLEARFLWGDRALFDELTKRFAQKFVAGNGRDFVEAKLAERDQRHHRMGNSRYVAGAQHQGGQGRPARPPYRCSGSPNISITCDEPDELVDRGRADARGGAAISSAPTLPLHGALPPALSHRPRRRSG